MADPTGMGRMRKKDPYWKRTSRAKKASKIHGDGFWIKMKVAVSPDSIIKRKRERKIRRAAKRMAIEKEAEKLAEEIAKTEAVEKLQMGSDCMGENGSDSLLSRFYDYLVRRSERKREKAVRRAMRRIEIEGEARKRLEAQEKEGDSSQY